MGFKERIDSIMDAGRKKEQEIAGMNPELLPRIRQERQAAERDRLLANMKRQIADVRLDAEKRQREVERGLREASYPMLSSVSSVDRTLGSAEYLASQSFGTLFPSNEYVQEHWGLQRYDYLSGLAERAHVVQGQNVEASSEKFRFLKLIAELFAERWKELPKEQQSLRAVMQRLTWIEESLKAGQIGGVPPGLFGPTLPAPLTFKDERLGPLH